MFSKKALIIVSFVLSSLLLLIINQKIDCGTNLSRCLDCYCGWSVKGWPLIWLNLEGGGLKMYKINYLYLFSDLLFYFLLVLILLSLINKLLALTVNKAQHE